MRWLVLLVLCAAPLAAQQRKPIDYALAGVTTGLLVADWSQTLQSVQLPGHTEMNPLIGAHGSRGRVNTYFAISLLLNASVFALPPKPRRITYVALTAIESFWILRNRSHGIHIGF